MNQAVMNWLVRFAAGAGSQYRWELVPAFVFDGKQPHIEYVIRARLADGEQMCPLSAQATYETGHIYPVYQWRFAADQQGMLGYERAGLLYLAADNDTQHDPEIRQHLLRICGLEEPQS